MSGAFHPDPRIAEWPRVLRGKPIGLPGARGRGYPTPLHPPHRPHLGNLTAKEVQTPLAERPYDLRHACVSTWLNAGVPATQVAEWAGRSVDVLLKIYAKCIVGQDEAAKRRISDALAAHG